MVSFERFEEILYELADRLPAEMYQHLDGGVFAREEKKIHPAAVHSDLVILGEYHVDPHLGRFVVLYYGSFRQVYGYLNEKDLTAQIWHVLRHEFLHHLESLAGDHSLERQDAIEIALYRKARGEA